MRNENDLAITRTLMADFGGAVGTTDGLQRICAKIYAAVGITRGEQLLARHSKDPNPGWRWLTEVAGEAARRQEALLVAQVFAFTAFWRTTVAPKLGPADWIDLLLPFPPDDMYAAVVEAALPCLLRLPPDQLVTGNTTEKMHAGDLATYAATQVLESPERYSDSLAVTAKEVLAPPATAAPAPTEESDSLLAPAVVRLDRVKKAVSEVGLRYVDLGEAVVGVGIGLSWSPTDWVVISIAAGGFEDLVAITAGVLKDVERDRPRILDECNTRTRENITYPVYLHDAQDGWDVLVQQRFHIDVLLTVPGLLHGTLSNLPIHAQRTRDEFREHGLRGETHEWNADTTRLLIRSLL